MNISDFRILVFTIHGRSDLERAPKLSIGPVAVKDFPVRGLQFVQRDCFQERSLRRHILFLILK